MSDSRTADGVSAGFAAAELAAAGKQLRDAALRNTQVAVPAAVVVATAWSAASAGLSIGGGGGPASVSRFSRLAAIGGTLRCGLVAEDDVDAPDFTEHPFQPEVAMGAATSEVAARVNGAALMSSLLTAAALLAELLVFFGHVTLTGAMARVMVAVSIAVPSFFAPGVVALSTAAVFAPVATTAVGVLHAVCLLIGVGVCAVYVGATVKAPQFAIMSPSALRLQDVDPKRAFVAAFGLLVDGLLYFPGTALSRLFFAEEVTASVAMSLLSALPAVTHAACVRRAAAVLVVSVAHGGYAVATRPLRSTVETVGTLIVAVLQVAFSATALLAVQALPDVSAATTTLLELGAMSFVVALFLLPVAVAVDELFFKKKAQKEVLEEETAAMIGASHASPLLSVPEAPPLEHSNETRANNVPSDPVKMNPLTRGDAHGNEQS